MTPFRFSLMISASLIAAAAVPAMAQDADGSQQAVQDQPGSDDLHDPIIVTATGVTRLDVLAGTSVVDATDLQRNMDGQVGEVLAKLPGVTASGFAPGASRPVLRGFGGERVRVLTDGIGSLDASSTSSDHAVSVDPLIADRIEVLRGPAVLLYGSEAIGGAVNVLTKRIPPRVPDEAVHVDALAGIDTAYDLREAGASFDVPLGQNFAAHVDGSYRETADMEIPGYAASPQLRQSLLADADAAEAGGDTEQAGLLRDAAAIRDNLPNSATRTYSGGVGAAWFSGDNDLGLSFDYYDTNYGVPGLPGIGETGVTIGMKKYRVDGRGTLDTGEGFIDEIKARGAWSTYSHTEFEDTGEPGTVFDVDGVEGRVEAVQSRRGPWRGSFGAQYSNVDLTVTGDEAFVPPSIIENVAAFALQELDFDPVEVEFGGRYEHVSVTVDTLGEQRSYDNLSGAIGLSYGLAPELRAGVNLSRAERAPSSQELFADGPHLATQQYELGSADLTTEKSTGLEGYLRGEFGPAQVSLSVYRNWFGDFIYLQQTGAMEDGLPVYLFQQQDADQWGVEGQLSTWLHHGGDFDLQAHLSGDYTRATLDDGTPVPRMPPLSLKGALEANVGHFDARGEVEWYAKQDRIAPYETPTDAFTIVNASLTWHPLEGADNLTLIAQVDNVFDVEGRRAASFTKDFVPLAGRNFKLTAMASF